MIVTTSTEGRYIVTDKNVKFVTRLIKQLLGLE